MYDKTRVRKADKEKVITFRCFQCNKNVRDYRSNRTKGRRLFCSAACRAKGTGISNSLSRGGDGVERTKPEKDKLDYSKHVSQRRSRAKNYYWLNREKILKNLKEKSRERKKLVIDAYGGKCECCGESNIEFLTIDHVDGGGASHRRKVGKGKGIYQDLIRLGFPQDNYRLLCFNCNISRGFYGYCPHHPEEQSVVSHVPFVPGRKRTVAP